MQIRVLLADDHNVVRKGIREVATAPCRTIWPTPLPSSGYRHGARP